MYKDKYLKYKKKYLKIKSLLKKGGSYFDDNEIQRAINESLKTVNDKFINKQYKDIIKIFETINWYKNRRYNDDQIKKEILYEGRYNINNLIKNICENNKLLIDNVSKDNILMDYQLNESLGDGNCLLHSLNSLIDYNNNNSNSNVKLKWYSTADWRKWLIKKSSNFRELMRQRTDQMNWPIILKEINAEINLLNQPDGYLGIISIQIMCNECDVAIDMFISNDSNRSVTSFYPQDNPNAKKFLGMLHYNGINHYNYLLPKK